MKTIKTSMTVIEIAHKTRAEKIEILESIEYEFDHASEYFYKTARAEALRNLYETVQRFME